jgi:hypothetical protein
LGAARRLSGLHSVADIPLRCSEPPLRANSGREQLQQILDSGIGHNQTSFKAKVSI